MSTPTLPEGIRVRGDSIVIDFRFRGQRCRETIKGLPPTKGNLKWAARKRATILLEIAQGTFDYPHHFPNSPNVRKFAGANQLKTVGQGLTEWLAICENTVSPQTYRMYTNAAEQYVRPKFGRIPLIHLQRSDIAQWVNADLAHLAPATIDAKLIPLKAVIKNAQADNIMTFDPMINVRPTTPEYEEPDPFTLTEIDRILAVTTDRRSEMNAARFALWSGVRTNELIALAWEDIDLQRGTARIQRARTRDHYRVPKTRRSVREIELLTPALDALQDQRALSEMRPATQTPVIQRNNRQVREMPLRFVFLNTRTGKPFSDPGTYRDGFWYTLLKKAGVRQRGSSNTRHTFISQMLTANMPKEWIVRQVGHASTQMIDQIYGKWVQEDALSMANIANERFAFGHMAVTGENDESKNSDDSTG